MSLSQDTKGDINRFKKICQTFKPCICSLCLKTPGHLRREKKKRKKERTFSELKETKGKLTSIQ